MNDRDSTFGDKLLGDALRLVTAGVDPELGSETVADALAALNKQAKALKAADYTSGKMKKVKCVCGITTEVELPSYESLAKTMAQTAKMIDETARLVQFTNGRPDSRPEVAGMPVDVLKSLTDAQLTQVYQWVEANDHAADGADEAISERERPA